ncbi:hypothetical protein IVB12_05370 [Bradyrhizobium sp. 179]|uniref:hypothetical protein n=1 Tax=Bradyrhizobium sp. 179 TaxID=2782648 RepID=UPI001FF82B95|nr:hypothetical protein [Bradyrhizobium sp. 179]MCK1541421.1 hypothetical protein [Bradyrhizobium sp. 179]
MRTASAISPNTANLRGAETGIDFSVLGIGSNVNAVISAVLKIKEPRKTWGFLIDLLPREFEMTERVAKHRLAGSRDYTVEELQALLRSEEGIDFLIAIMGDAQPLWWRWMTKVMTLAAVRRRQAEDAQEILKLETSGDVDVGARRRIKGALNADKRISAAVARAETTLGLSRPNLDRVGATSDGRNARLPHRPVARTGGR